MKLLYATALLLPGALYGSGVLTLGLFVAGVTAWELVARRRPRPVLAEARVLDVAPPTRRGTRARAA
jgi:hypothetical protein